MTSRQGKIHWLSMGTMLIALSLASLAIGFLTAFTVVGPIGFGIISVLLLMLGIYFLVRQSKAERMT